MTTAQRKCNRRQALGAIAASAAALGFFSSTAAEDKPRRRPMILSFYCDDTSPSVAGAKAFQDFLDFCGEHKIAGESTCLLGSSRHSLCRNPNEQELAFLHEVGRAWVCSIDTHMELMTHRGLFDFDASETEGGIHQKASDGPFGVYDLMPNAMDHFGIWENNPARVNPDYYLSADGKSGIIVRHLAAGLPYCIWYAHWQGLNPAKGVGWRAFTTVVERIRTQLGDQVVWMRPSDITHRYHQASGNWSFLDHI